MTRIYIKCIPVFFFAFSLYQAYSVVQAASYTSNAFLVRDPVIGIGLYPVTSVGFGLGQTLGQAVVGKSTSSQFQLWSGFQFYVNARSNTLTGTPGDGQVSLSWTAPNLSLGASVGSYEVGTGTVSGSYVFENVGTGTSFIKSGLTNGVPYFFIVKAKTPGGMILVFSNEVTVTPVVAPSGGATTGGGGGGGGGNTPIVPGGNAAITIKGLAYPGARVSILRDGVFVATTTADPGASFSVTISRLAPASYVFSVYANDATSKKSQSYSFTEVLSDNVSIVVDNVFLSPTIGVDLATVKQGDPISVFGSSSPNAQVNVYVHSENQLVEKVLASASGAWFKQFDTSFLEIGGHTAESRAVIRDRVSPMSPRVAFRVGTESIPLEDRNDVLRSDLNKDGKVNIIDFSLLLYFWNQKTPSNPTADINMNNNVDLTDLSLMLYDWTG